MSGPRNVSGPRVGLVLVSHSAAAAEGTVEIAQQMAPDVTLVAAGGTPEGVGTSVDRVLEAVQRVLGQDGDPGVVVLTDLGSAVLTTDAVVEMLDAFDEGASARVRVPDAPFLEGAVAAAVEAQQGGDLVAVETAAVRAGMLYASSAPPAPSAPVSPPAPSAPAPGGGAVTARVVLSNPLGLHARPAAVLARAIADSGVPVTVDGVDGSSVLELMRLGATGGRELTLVASGPSAEQTLQRVVALVEGGFGEV